MRSSSIFFLNCLSSLQKCIFSIAAMPQHFALFICRVPSKDTNQSLAQQPLSRNLHTSIFFVKGRRVAKQPNTPAAKSCCFSLFFNRTCYDQRHDGRSHLAPQTAGSRYSFFLLKAIIFSTYGCLLLQINKEAENGRVE